MRDIIFSESESRCFLAWVSASVCSLGTEGSEARIVSIVDEI